MNRNTGAGELELAGIANPRDRDRAELARRQAAAPLRASKPQAPCDLGLFGDTAAQLDLVDQARAMAR